MVINFLRRSVRPLVCLGFGLAFIGACFFDETAAQMIGPPAMLAIGWYFRERTVEKGS